MPFVFVAWGCVCFFLSSPLAFDHPIAPQDMWHFDTTTFDFLHWRCLMLENSTIFYIVVAKAVKTWVVPPSPSLEIIKTTLHRYHIYLNLLVFYFWEVHMGAQPLFCNTVGNIIYMFMLHWGNIKNIIFCLWNWVLQNIKYEMFHEHFCSYLESIFG